MYLHGKTELEYARKRTMEEAALPGGVTCPCCDKHAQIYRRKFLCSMAIELVNILPWYENNPGESLAINHYLVNRRIFYGSYSKLCFWGLLEQDTEKQEGKKHSGHYSITQKGIDFANNEIAIREYVIEYNKKVTGFNGRQIYIDEAFKNKFDYEELMSELMEEA